MGPKKQKHEIDTHLEGLFCVICLQFYKPNFLKQQVVIKTIKVYSNSVDVVTT